MKRKKFVLFSSIAISIVVILLLIFMFIPRKTNLTFVIKVPNTLKDMPIKFEITLLNCFEECEKVVNYPDNNRATFEKLKPDEYEYVVKAFGRKITDGKVVIEKRRAFGGLKEKIQKLTLPIPGNLVELSYDVMDEDNLKVNWMYEGWFPVQKYELSVDGKVIGTTDQREFVLPHSVFPKPDKAGERKINLEIKAKYKNTVLAKGNLIIKDFISKVMVNGLEKFLPYGVTLKVGKRTLKITKPEFLFGRFKESVSLPLHVVFKDFEIFSGKVVFSNTKKVQIDLPPLPKVEDIKLRIIGNKMRLEWKMGKTSLNLPKPEYFISLDGKDVKTSENWIELDYVEDELKVSVTPVFFGSICCEKKEFRKPKAPDMIAEYQGKTIESTLPVSIKVISQLNCRVFMRELSPDEGKWTEITGKDVVFLNLPKFGRYIFEFEMIDEIGQEKIKKVVVERLEPQKVSIDKVFLDVNELIVKWKPENDFYEKYSLVLQDSKNGKVKVMEVKGFEGKIDVDGIAIEGSKLTLYGIIFGKSVKLDEKTLKLKERLEDYVKLNIGKFQNPNQGFVEYKILDDSKFVYLKMKVIDADGKIQVDKILKSTEGLISWNAQFGNLYQIYLEYNSKISRLTSHYKLKYFPESPGIVEIYQTDIKKIECIASDFGKWADYIWTIKFDDLEKTFKTSERSLKIDLESAGFKVNFDERKKLTISLKIQHKITGATFTDSKNVYLIKAKRYLYRDITEPTILKDIDDLYISRGITIKDELKLENANVKVAPGISIRVFGKIELYLTNMRSAISDKRWEGLKSFEKSSLIMKDSTIQGVNVFIDSIGSDIYITNSELRKFNIGIFSNRSSIRVENSKIREGGKFIQSSESKVKISDSEFLELQSVLYSKYDSSDILISSTFKDVTYPLNAVGCESLNIDDLDLIEGKVGFDVEDSKFDVSNVRISKFSVGFILTNSDVSIDRLNTKNVDLSVDSKYSYLVLKNCVLNSTDGVKFITSPVIRKEKYDGRFIVGVVKDTTINSKGTALEIVSGENDVLLENVEYKGNVIDGGYFVDIRGMVVKRGEFIRK